MRAFCAFLLLFTPCAAGAAELAIVTQDRVALRAAPRSGAPVSALLWQGETVEIRAARREYLQVYDYRRERGGFVRASEVQRVALRPAQAAALLANLRLLRAMPGAEALGIGFAAAYIEAASAEALASEAGAEALEALGVFAERLAERASAAAQRGKAAQEALAGHLDVAARYGVQFVNREHAGTVRICYDGEAYRRLLSMPSTAEQRAHAALALTRQECMRNDAAADLLERPDAAALPGHLRARLLVRRAAVWARLAYAKARSGEPAHPAARRALAELAAADKAELGEEDARDYNDAAMAVGASLWAAMPERRLTSGAGPRIATAAGAPGETCVLVIDAKNDARKPLAGRCTYAMVWSASVSVNREGNAAVLAVQPTPTWRELWIARKSAKGWSIRVLPPAATTPHIGYVEFAGWVPGGQQLLVAREARGAGRYRRSFERVRLDTLATVAQAAEPGGVSGFRRWQDAEWKSRTVSLR